MRRNRMVFITLFLVILAGAVTVRTSEAQTLEDGTYSIPVSLWNASKDEPSMGNKSLYQTGKLVVTEGEAFLSMKFSSMEFSGFSGYLMQLDLIENIEFNEFGYPEKYGEIPAEVISVYSAVDEFNAADSTDLNCAGRPYPRVIRIPAELGKEYTWAHVYVPVMGSLGFGDQVCKIKLTFEHAVPMTEEEKKKWVEYETDELQTSNPVTETEEKSDQKNSADPVEADKAELKAKLARAQKLLKQKEKYTTASLSKLEAVAENARKAVKNDTASQTVIDAQAEALKEAMEALVEKAVKVLDKNNLEDGKYSVYVDLWHAASDRASMGNPAFNHEALLTVKKGVYSLEISTRPMTVGTVTACLQTLQIKQTDGSYVYADITSRNNAGGQPSVFCFTLPSKKEYIEVMIDPKVEVMGEDPLPARLKISWDTLRAVEEKATVKENTVEIASGTDSTPADLTDSATGVRITAEANILENGVALVVRSILSGEEYEKAEELLQIEGSSLVLYDISIQSSAGIPVQPSGMVKVYLPVPEGMDTANIAVYRIENGTKTLMSGKEEEGYYVFATNHFSLYGLVEEGEGVESAGNGVSGESAVTPDNRQVQSEGMEEGPEVSLGQRDPEMAEIFSVVLLCISVSVSFIFAVIVILVVVKPAGGKKVYYEQKED